MSAPCSTVEFRAYDRDGLTLRGAVKVRSGAAWTDELGGSGTARLSAPLVQSVLTTLPTMLDDSIVKIAMDLGGDPDDLTEIPFAFLGEGGERALVHSGEDADKDRTLQCRSLCGLLDDITVHPEGGWQTHSGDERAFGWMSQITAHSFDSSQFDGTISATRYKDVASGSDRFQRPKHWPDPKAAWVGCGAKERQFFRCQRWVGENTRARVFVSADENVRVWHNSELVIKSNSNENGYTKMHHWSGVLGPGLHTFGIEYRKVHDLPHGSDTDEADRMIFTLMEVNDRGHLTTVLRRSSDNTDVWLACQRDDDEDPPSWTAAGIIRQLITEARDRGVDAAQNLTLTFDRDEDSGGNDFSDLHEKKWPVGAKLSQVVADLGEHGVDPDVVADPDDGVRFDLWASQGVDRSDDVIFTVGGNVLSYQIGVQPPVGNSLLVRSASRWQLREDLTSIAAGGRREAFLKLGRSLSALQARRRADKALENYAWDLETHVVEILPVAGCVPYLDFGKGDVVMALDREGDPAPMRVVSISGQVPDAGPVRFTVELQAP